MSSFLRGMMILVFNFLFCTIMCNILYGCIQKHVQKGTKALTEYRLDSSELFGILQDWNQYLRKRVQLIACGGTAMTLQGVKPSTKDIDFMVPENKEREYLLKTLKDLGYENVTQYGWQRPGEQFRFDLFRENYIHTTGLLLSPLIPGRNTQIMRYSRLYVGILNDYDLIVSKLVRGSRVDFDDCVMLVRAHISELNIDTLVAHFNELISYDISEQRIKKNIDHLLERLRDEGIYEQP